ncbi:MAG: hypothetical protein D6785_01740 [Planctomycetota bacterium]|nr:MAG: hypothetical protein D6785_01740 [Planctomycetota bacterium]
MLLDLQSPEGAWLASNMLMMWITNPKLSWHLLCGCRRWARDCKFLARAVVWGTMHRKGVGTGALQRGGFETHPYRAVSYLLE